jgi:CubicO group peptidase (beta-lactamase class C family)
MKFLFAFFLSIISITAGIAQNVKNITTSTAIESNGFSPDRLSRIDQTIQDHVTKAEIPGAVALIIRDGKIVYHKAFGYSDIEKKTPLQKNDIFRIASQTKAITSLAVMMLWEEGKFLLDEPISKYIPEFKSPTVLKTFNAADSSYTTEPAKNEITIRHLLTHTSGLDYAGIGSPEFKAIYAKAGIPSGIGNDQFILGERIRILAKLPLKHQPGERWTYGLNTDVLGHLVEVLSKMSFDQFLKKRIFDPLGMNDTYFYLPSDRHSRLVTLHHYKDNKLAAMKEKAYDGVDPFYPRLAGKYFSGGAGLSSTVEDYAKFLQLFLNKGEYNGARLLSRKTVELMLTDQISESVSSGTEFGLGFGLETDANDSRSSVSKGSFSWGGAFNTHYWADPKERLIGILYTNMYSSPLWNIGERFKNLTYQSIND